MVAGFSPFLAARKYQAVGYGKPYPRTESMHVRCVLDLMETGVDVFILPSGDTLRFVSQSPLYARAALGCHRRYRHCFIARAYS